MATRGTGVARRLGRGELQMAGLNARAFRGGAGGRGRDGSTGAARNAQDIRDYARVQRASNRRYNQARGLSSDG